MIAVWLGLALAHEQLPRVVPVSGGPGAWVGEGVCGECVALTLPVQAGALPALVTQDGRLVGLAAPGEETLRPVPAPRPWWALGVWVVFEIGYSVLRRRHDPSSLTPAA